MDDLKRRLEGSDVLAIVLSGMGAGRYRNLRDLLRRGFGGEIEDEEYTIPPVVKGLFFTDITGSLTASFEHAWLPLVELALLEPIGYGGDYVVQNQLLRYADIWREETGMPQMGYDSIQEVGRRISQL